MLASVLTVVGCTHTIVRHDLFERTDVRLQRAMETAQRACQQEQPKTGLPSTADYERCVLAEWRNPKLTAARR